MNLDSSNSLSANDNAMGSVAIIGCGNMGAALLRGFYRRREKTGATLIACDSDSKKVDTLVEELGIRGTTDPAEAVSLAQTIVIALKPSITSQVASLIRKPLKSKRGECLLVSIVAGKTVESYRSIIGDWLNVVRVMPNLPVLIGQGVSAIYAEDSNHAETCQSLFSAVGSTLRVEKEEDLNTATAIGGSGPAFICVVIEAMSDAGVKLGLPRKDALKMAVQTVLGTAALLKEGEGHPAILKDMVASPGGTTIRGLHVLEDRSVRGALICAIEEAAKRAQELAAQR